MQYLDNFVNTDDIDLKLGLLIQLFTLFKMNQAVVFIFLTKWSKFDQFKNRRFTHKNDTVKVVFRPEHV